MTEVITPSTVDRVLSEVEALRAGLVEAVGAAVRIPSVNPRYPGQVYADVVGGEGEVARFVASIYADIGCEVDVFAIEPGRENAVGVLRGAGGGRSLIFNGHVDVVPAGEYGAWTGGDPFSGRSDGERIWGRGSTDMKGGVLAQAFAAMALRNAGVRLRGDLLLEAVAGEEVMDHEVGTTATVKRGYVADAAVVAEPSGPPYPLAVIPVTPGLLWFSLTVRGKPSHACMRAQTIRAGGAGAAVAVSAIDKGVQIFQALRELEEQWGQTKRHDLFAPGHFTIHPGVVTGGPAGVLVPFAISEFMTTEYCVWFHPDDEPEAVKHEIEEHVRRAAQLDPWLRDHPPEIEWKLTWPAAVVDTDHPIVRATQRAHELGAVGTPYAGEAKVWGFLAVEDTSFLILGGVPAISYGPGDVRLAHAYDENIVIEELVTACKTYALLALEWCGATI